jgi:beta propeller repeat protein
MRTATAYAALAPVLAALSCAEAPDDAPGEPTWRAGNGGGVENGRVAICHGVGTDRHTIQVPAPAISAHLGHGDALGSCPTACVSAEECADGNACTTDVCQQDGTCAHAAVDCNDGDPCTIESCSPTLGCGSTPADGVICDDGNECTDDDACAQGVCQGAAIAGCCLDDADCEDADGCTVDACVAGVCDNSPLDCTIADACVVGFCDPSSGECSTAAVSCDDGNPCTTDGCASASGCTHAPVDDWTCGTITQISTAYVSESEPPAISGTRVVWTERSPTGTTDVMLHDLADGSTRNLTDTPSDWERLPEIDGQHVVWLADHGPLAYDIMLHDLATDTSTIIAETNADGFVWDPSIRQGVVAWRRRDTNGYDDVEIYNISSGTTGSLPADSVSNLRVTRGTFGPQLVYEARVDGGSRYGLVGFDLALGPMTVPASPEGWYQQMPDAEGYTMVYVERGPNPRLLAQDYRYQALQQLASLSSWQAYPRISGTRVVWADDRTFDWDIHAYDLATGRESVLVDGPGDQRMAAIDGDRVVYVDNGPGTTNGVYVFDFGG